VLGVDSLGEFVEQVSRHLRHFAALLAHEMVVRPVGQAEDRCARSELDSLDDGELDKSVKRAVDRALVEVGVLDPYGGDNLGCGQVVAGAGQHGFDHAPTRTGDAPALPAALIEDRPHSFVDIVAMVRGPTADAVAWLCNSD